MEVGKKEGKRLVSEKTRAKMRAAKLGVRRGPISEETRRRMSAAQKGRRRPPLSEEAKAHLSEVNQGKQFSAETRARISAANTGKVRTEEQRRRIGEASAQRPPKSEETRRKLSEALRGRTRSPEHSYNLSESMKRAWLEGRKHSSGWGKHGVREDLGGQFFRSTWEANYARVLNLCGVEWQYEPKRFDTPIGSYCPDFYLPMTGEYVEVKGIETSVKQLVKRNWLVEQGVLQLTTLGPAEYAELVEEYAVQLPGWEA